ncbi:MAG TPA: hypothetical protein QGF95_07865 [Candidatus Latescibacteria bacterium]|jgi:hypothetical protein|nr:hypothetical protein [Gemmatimonadaceae bacterium]MDP6017245.1 hypothetical protein [Candidatus Latescibacterota bacterium]HJP30455.1 hypothetical protein [Candidatus Latescibacterota bacterium]
MDLACFHIPHFAAWALAQRWSDATAPGEVAPAIVACAHGRVLATTPALRGTLAVGDPVDRARRMAPGAQFLLRDPSVERALWDHVLFRLYDLTPQVQPVPDPLAACLNPGRRKRSGSGFLYESPATGLWDNGAWAMLQGPDHGRLQNSATDLGACVGVSSARSWSMLAATYAAAGSKSGTHGSITTVPGHMIAPFLRQAPVTLLETLRFDPDLVERLQLFGMRAIHHAIHVTRRQLQAQFGTEGVRLYELLHPAVTEAPVAPFDPCILDTSHDFDWPVFEPGELQPVLHHLLAQLITRLDGRSARHLEIVLHGRSATRRRANRILKEPTARFDVLRTAADTLLHLALTGDPTKSRQVPSGRSVKRLSITFSGLTELPGRQARLFAERTDLLPGLVRAMESRFPGKLTRPVRAHADPFFPEEEYRFEPVA